MKKKLCLALVALCIFMGTANTGLLNVYAGDGSRIRITDTDMVTRASKCIHEYGSELYASGNGNLDISAYLVATNKGKIDVTMTLQIYRNGNWSYVTSWEKSSSNSSVFGFSTTYRGTAGETYRLVTNFRVTVNGAYDSRMQTLSTKAK